MRAIRPFILRLLVCVAACAPIGTASAKFVVDQIYSNANGSIQFVVLVADGPSECRGFSIFSTHVGVVVSGQQWPGVFSRSSGARVLVASDGFGPLGVIPDFRLWDGFLATDGGTIRVCYDEEFHYASLPVDGVTALDRSGSLVQNVATNSAGDSVSVTSEQAASAGMLRLGLTGSWFDPATSGQGFEIEVAPDSANFGFNVMVGWFTYDVGASGGAERQRWYTLFAHVGPGDYWAPVALDIYRNVGGNFDAGPITSAQKVGSATLLFTACDRGTLDYAFTDGSGRSGRIPITRVTQNVTCHPTGTSRSDPDFALSGNWYDPATSGQGIFVEINPVSNAAFVAWYTYAPNGAAAGAAGQRWYTAQATYVANTRTIPLTIYETTGGLFDAPSPSPQTTAVGTATLAFQSCDAATLSYDFSKGSSAGARGTIALRRLLEAFFDCEIWW
jgi:hypothetical protein